MHPDAYDLLLTALLKPADDQPRRVYADWLEENGRGDLAELIRLECHLPGAENGTSKTLAMLDRRDKLRKAVLPGHLLESNVNGPPPTFVWDRGLIECVHLSMGRIGCLADDSLALWHPITLVQVIDNTFTTGVPVSAFGRLKFIQAVIANGQPLRTLRTRHLPGVSVLTPPR